MDSTTSPPTVKEPELSQRHTNGNGEGSRSETEQPQFVDYNQLPGWLQDNDLVTSGYRPANPNLWSCLISLVHLHNETVSIWSHLLASLYFLTLYVARSNEITECPALANDDLFLRLYHLSAIFAFTSSSIYHLFCCYSHFVRDLLVRIDYVGITVFITESFMTWIYYAFHKDTVNTSVYVYAICFGGFLVAVLTQLDAFNGRDNRTQRACLYFTYGLSLIIPVFLLFVQSSDQRSIVVASIFYTGIIYILGGLIYSFRLPERFRPGSVNIFGHSHQLFHVIVVIAAIIHERMIVHIALINAK